MHHRFQRLMAVLTGATRNDLRRQVQFLKAENEVLRSRIKGRIRTTPREHARLVKLGKPLGPAIKGLITIVSPRTFAKWISSARHRHGNKVRRPRGPGRQRTPEQTARLILKLARETDWGLTRIRGELFKLGIKLSRSAISNILKEHGIEPAPNRGESGWDQFLRRHAKTLWACDFLGARVLTTKGMRYAFALVFIHVNTRRAFISASTTKPDAEWCARTVRALLDAQPAGHPRPGILIRDRDSKFGRDFDEALKAARVTPLLLPFRSPNLNAFAERLIQSVRVECLDRFVVLGLRHLDHLLAEYTDYHNRQRPHSSLGSRTPTGPPPRIAPGSIEPARVRCQERLGGVIKHYYRKAA